MKYLIKEKVVDLYEFTFIAQQSLLPQEVEGMAHELAASLTSIKADVIFQQIKEILKREGDELIKQDLDVHTKNIQESLHAYHDFLENFAKILWVGLEEDLSNLQDIKLQVSKRMDGTLKNSGIIEKFSGVSDKTTKSMFISSITQILRESILKDIVKIFQGILKNLKIEGTTKSSREVEMLLKNVVTSGMIKYEYWGLLDFAYPINKMKSGHYCMMCVSSTADIMNEFVRRIKLNENVIRHLSVQVDKFFEGKSYMVNKQIEEQSA